MTSGPVGMASVIAIPLCGLLYGETPVTCVINFVSGLASVDQSSSRVQLTSMGRILFDFVKIPRPPVWNNEGEGSFKRV